MVEKAHYRELDEIMLRAIRCTQKHVMYEYLPLCKYINGEEGELRWTDYRVPSVYYSSPALFLSPVPFSARETRRLLPMLSPFPLNATSWISYTAAGSVKTRRQSPLTVTIQSI